ncbi:M16 family metallopeptidase [Frateuria hangzhouensis]|uniref:M16 family metallopeptidase n=1 Tax=Frateuria hangzhouensis TaxID=2995589 RepID=UPI002260E66C|nr:pitrilysin family protein [Frateuria sp. STR12]MCX7513293.1 pitrilysin family protein [Frateuria sp. STR12]
MNRLIRTRLAVFTAVLLCAAPALAGTTDFPATPPAPGPAPTLSLPTPSSQTLANGLRVVSIRRDGLPLVTAELLLRRGIAMDPPGKAGLAKLTATLLTRGAAGRSAPQIAAAAEALGGSLDADADWDHSSVGITVTTPKLPAALALLAQVTLQPAFAPAELERARSQALDDLHLMLSQPTQLAILGAGRAVFGDGAYGHSPAGTAASLKAIGRDDVLRMHAAVYRPDDAVLILTGDVTPAQARALAEQSFGDWKRPQTPLAVAPAGMGKSQLPAVLVIDQPGAGQAGVVAAHAAPPRNDAGYYAGTVANAVLGDSYSARLNEEIRIKRGLSYGAFSVLDGRRGNGMWLAQAQTKNPSAAKVVDLMLGQFARLGQAPVPADELAARKATLIGSYGRSLETTAGLADRLGALATYNVDLAEIGRYIGRVQAVTAAQVQAYARAHLDITATHVVAVGDASKFGEALRNAHPDAVRLDAAALDLDRPSLGLGQAKGTGF